MSLSFCSRVILLMYSDMDLLRQCSITLIYYVLVATFYNFVFEKFVPWRVWLQRHHRRTTAHASQVSSISSDILCGHSRVRTMMFCGPLPDPRCAETPRRQAYVTDAGRVHVAMFGDAGEVTEVSCCNVLICALVFPFCVLAGRQPRLLQQAAVRMVHGLGVLASGKAKASGRVDVCTGATAETTPESVVLWWCPRRDA